MLLLLLCQSEYAKHHYPKRHQYPIVVGGIKFKSDDIYFHITILKLQNYLPSAVIRSRGNQVKAEIAAMEREPFEVPGLNVKIRHKCCGSMIDGKVRNVLTEVTNAMQNCPICGATPIQMSRPKGELHNFEPIDGALDYASFGVHAYLRSWANFNKARLHWDFKQWSCR